MRKSGIGLLLAGLAAFFVGCSPDVDKPGQSFIGEVDLKASASGPGTITPGTNGEWTFTVDNAGPEAAEGVDVEIGVDPAGSVLANSIRWTCTATGGSCGSEEGKGAPATTLSLENGGSAVITVTTPVSYSAASGADLVATVSVGEDSTYPDPTPGDNEASASATLGEAQALADFSDEIIYWAFTDRFANGDPTNDDADGTRRGDEADPSSHIGWHGGDFAGIRQKIEEGYFQAMGFTAVWISPVIYQVPALDNGNAAYHGYWPEASLEIEPHFGTIGELKALVDTAHANGLKVIVDFVANHVGYDAEIVQTNRDWVRLGSECQSPDNDLERACLGGLPDLRQELAEVTDFTLSQIQNLVASTGIDGFRWDAQRFVNNEFWTEAFAPGAPADRSSVWSMGENTEGPERLAYWMDTVGTPSTRDFALHGAFRGAIAGFSDSLAEVLEQDSLYSDPRRLSTFIDNHDNIRVTSDIIQQRGYDRATALELVDAGLTFLYANRGIPSVYYGTEIGMEGIDDFNFPDNSNRKSMDFEAAGDPTVTECYVEDQGLDNTEAFGTSVFLRGAFNDWADPPLAESQVFNQGDGVYAQAVQLSAGSYAFKVAAADWSVERTNDAETVVPGTSVTLNTSGGNTNLEIAADGCYRFDVDTSASVDNPGLTVSRLDVAAPLVRRLARLAAARTAYPALRQGSQTLLYDFSEQCSVPPTWPPSALPGQLFMRGGFNDWGNPPESAFIRTEIDTYEAEFEITAGSYEYKIATADWSYERTVDGQATPFDTELSLIPGGGQPNSQLSIPEDGCYNFSLDASDPESLVLTASADTDGTCAPVSSDPDGAAFGAPVYVRGSFNDWAEPAVEGDRFALTAPGVLSARVGLTPGDDGAPLSYKIASADYGVERVVLGGPTVLDSSQLIGIPTDNGTLTIEEAGCYDWTIDVSDPEVAYLTVSKAGDGSDVFALRRDLDGAASVLLVMNMGDGPADLSVLGGLPADGLADGPAVEITGAETDLVFTGGVLSGTIPPRTAYLVSDR